MSIDLDDIGSMVEEIGPKIKDGNFVSAFEKIEEDLHEQHDQMFQHGRDAGGTPWKPLRPLTIARKGHAIVLIEFGDLYESLISRANNAIRELYEQEMTFGTSDPKAVFHQHGTSRMPARPPVGISDETTDMAAQHVADRALDLALEEIDQWLK